MLGMLDSHLHYEETFGKSGPSMLVYLTSYGLYCRNCPLLWLSNFVKRCRLFLFALSSLSEQLLLPSSRARNLLGQIKEQLLQKASRSNGSDIVSTGSYQLQSLSWRQKQVYKDMSTLVLIGYQHLIPVIIGTSKTISLGRAY